MTGDIKKVWFIKQDVMYITNFTDLLDNHGNIMKHLPVETRKLADFLASIIERTTGTMPSKLTSTGIRCFRERCSGIIKSAFRPKNEVIHWFCPDCINDGIINSWQETKWNVADDCK
jgi:hypothetical protein